MKNTKRINLIKTLVALTPLCLTSCLMGNQIHFQKQVHEVNFHNTFFNANAKEKVSLLELTNVLHKNFTKEIQSNFQKRINYYKNYRAKAYALSVENLFSKGSLIGETQSKIFNNPNADQKIISNNLKITYAIKNFTDYRIIDGQLIFGSTYKNQKLNLRITCTAKNGAGVTTDLNNVYGLGLNNQEYNNRYYEHFVNVLNSFQWPKFNNQASQQHLDPLSPNNLTINFADAFQSLMKEVKQTASTDNLNPQLYTDYNFSIQNVFIQNQTSNPVTSDNNSFKGLVLKLSNNYQNSRIIFQINTGSSAGTKYFSKTFVYGAEKIANSNNSSDLIASSSNTISFINDLNLHYQGISVPSFSQHCPGSNKYLVKAPSLSINLLVTTYFLDSGDINTKPYIQQLNNQMFWDPSGGNWKLNNNLSNLMGFYWSHPEWIGYLRHATKGFVVGKINQFDVNKTSFKAKCYQNKDSYGTHKGVMFNITGSLNFDYGPFSGGWVQLPGQGFMHFHYQWDADKYKNYLLHWNLAFSTWSDFSANDQEANLTFSHSTTTNTLVASQYLSSDNQIISTIANTKTIGIRDYENFGKSYGQIKTINYSLTQEPNSLQLESYNNVDYIYNAGNFFEINKTSHKLIPSKFVAVTTQSAFLSEKTQKNMPNNPSQIKNYSKSSNFSQTLENTNNIQIQISKQYQTLLSMPNINIKLVGNALYEIGTSSSGEKFLEAKLISLNHSKDKSKSNTEVTNVTSKTYNFDPNIINCHLSYNSSDNSYAIVGTEKTSSSTDIIFQYHWFNFVNN